MQHERPQLFGYLTLTRCFHLYHSAFKPHCSCWQLELFLL